MIQIHTFYCDLLQSIPILIDNYILPSKYIKSYQFNIANRTFNLFDRNNKHNPYTPNIELPASIISLVDTNDSNFIYGERPSNIQKLSITNINQLPVLCHEESDTTIFLQEDHIQTNISIAVNSGSQLQAKDIGYSFNRVLPSNKFIQVLEFTSFLEIPISTLTNLGLDPYNQTITNLFCRLNKNTGGMEFTYAVHYKPLIQLNSINTSIAQTQQTFTTTIDLTYQIQYPLYLVYNRDYIIDRINIDYTKFNHESVTQKMQQSVYNNLSNLSNNYTYLNLLISDFSDYEISNLDSKVYILFKLDTSYLDLSLIDHFNIFDIYGSIHYNIGNPTFDLLNNSATIEFDEIEFNTLYQPSITNPILLQFVKRRLT